MIPIVDLTQKLPRHPTKRWRQRKVADIARIVVHQAAGDGTLDQIARYHISTTADRDGDGIVEGWERNHLSATGAPALCYTFAITRDGTIAKANDIDDITWHVGGSKLVKNPNQTSLGILVAGNFSGPGWEGTQDPSEAQLKALPQLLWYIRSLLGELPYFGHCELDPTNKPACPGTVIMQSLDNFRKGTYDPISIFGFPAVI